MKRRNFLSGLLGAPLALKARLARFFARKRLPVELGVPIFGSFVIGDSEIRQSCVDPQHNQDFMTALAAGESGHSLRAALSREAASWKADNEPARSQPVRCSLPRGHKGPHMLLNTPESFSPEESGAMRRKVPEILPGLIAALPRIRVKQISQMISGRGLIDPVMTVDEGVALFPGEGSQPACGYQPARAPAVEPCALPRNHKPPHVCRIRAIRLGFRA